VYLVPCSAPANAGALRIRQAPYGESVVSRWQARSRRRRETGRPNESDPDCALKRGWIIPVFQTAPGHRLPGPCDFRRYGEPPGPMEPVELAKRERSHIDLAARPKDCNGLHEVRRFCTSQDRCRCASYCSGYAVTGECSTLLPIPVRPFEGEQ
jgi:hypothetical protein